MSKRGYLYDEVGVGLSSSFSKTVTESDIHAFSSVTGDFSPVHVDAEYMRTSSLGKKMGGRIAQGMLTASFFSTLIGNHIPGRGALYVSQTCNFRRAVKIGDTITAKCEIVEKLPKNRLRLLMTCTNQHGEIVVDGEAIAITAKTAEDAQ